MAVSLPTASLSAFPGRVILRMLCAGLLLLHATVVSMAQDSVSIGVSAPLSGYFSIIGDQVEAGARTAAENADPDALVFYDDACEAEGGGRTAEEMIRDNVRIAIGYPCIEAFDAAMPKLAEANIPLLLLGVQSEAITHDRHKGNWPVLRLAPKGTDEADAIAGHLKQAWRGINFAIIDDGTLYGRQLAEAVRFRLEEDNLKPVFVDTYRPQLDNQVPLIRRLQKAGATHVFAGGDASDAAIIGANAAEIGVPLTLAGGSAFLAPASAGTLADGTILAALPAWEEADDALPGNESVGVSPAHVGNGYLVPAQAAVEIALAIFDGKSGDDGFFFGDLLGRTFDTVLGPMRFDGNGDVARNLFEIFVIENGKPVPVGAGGNTGSIQ